MKKFQAFIFFLVFTINASERGNQFGLPPAGPLLLDEFNNE